MANKNLYVNVDDLFAVLECIRVKNKGKKVKIDEIIDELVETTHDLDWAEVKDE